MYESLIYFVFRYLFHEEEYLELLGARESKFRLEFTDTFIESSLCRIPRQTIMMIMMTNNNHPHPHRILPANCRRLIVE